METECSGCKCEVGTEGAIGMYRVWDVTIRGSRMVYLCHKCYAQLSTAKHFGEVNKHGRVCETEE